VVCHYNLTIGTEQVTGFKTSDKKNSEHTTLWQWNEINF